MGRGRAAGALSERAAGWVNGTVAEGRMGELGAAKERAMATLCLGTALWA